MYGKLRMRGRAERCAPSDVRCADHCARRDQLQRTSNDAIVRADDCRTRLQRLAARQLAPHRDRAEHVIADQRGGEHDRRDRETPVRSQASGSEHCGGDERWNLRGRVVEVNRAL